MRLLCAAGLLAGLVGLAGCGGSGQAAVEGTVTYDGQPIDGAIAFVGGERSAGAAVIAGKYEIPAETGPLPGDYKVQIRWQKKTGKKFKTDAGEFDDAKEGLPAKYHDATTLTATVKGGKNVIDFNLEK
jgi:hypothetical protein